VLVGDQLGQLVQVPLDEVAQGEQTRRGRMRRRRAFVRGLLAAATAASRRRGSASATWGLLGTGGRSTPPVTRRRADRLRPGIQWG